MRYLPCCASYLAAIGAAAAQAAEGPSFDCGRAESSAEKLVCEDQALAEADRRLAARYEAAVAVAMGLDAGSKATLDELEATQRGWIKGRDDCWKAEDLRDCVEYAYESREGALVAQFLLDEPSEVMQWTCGGNRADELVVYVFPTSRPSVRLERGDRVTTGVLSPYAEGVLYEAPFGASLRLMDEEALLEWPEGEITRCAPQ